MAKVANQRDWNHTASIMALLANCHRGQGQRAFRISDFHPCPPKQQCPDLIVSGKEFKRAFQSAEKGGGRG